MFLIERQGLNPAQHVGHRMLRGQNMEPIDRESSAHCKGVKP